MGIWYTKNSFEVSRKILPNTFFVGHIEKKKKNIRCLTESRNDWILCVWVWCSGNVWSHFLTGTHILTACPFRRRRKRTCTYQLSCKCINTYKDRERKYITSDWKESQTRHIKVIIYFLAKKKKIIMIILALIPYLSCAFLIVNMSR